MVSFTPLQRYPQGRATGTPWIGGWLLTWRKEKSYPHQDSNSDTSAVQPVAGRYIICAIPAPRLTLTKYLMSVEGNVTILFVFYRAALREHRNSDVIHMHSLFLSIWTAAATVKPVCKYCGVLEATRILIPHLFVRACTLIS
jgi:hypothetical protein